MEIKIDVFTNPITISRVQAAKNIGTSCTIIDRAINNDKIDFGWSGRNKMVIMNEKWIEFVKKYK